MTADAIPLALHPAECPAAPPAAQAPSPACARPARMRRTAAAAIAQSNSAGRHGEPALLAASPAWRPGGAPLARPPAPPARGDPRLTASVGQDGRSARAWTPVAVAAPGDAPPA